MNPFIDTLIRQDPDARADSLRQRYERNRSYFTRRHPALDNLLESVACPFSIDLNGRFLDIRDLRSNAHVEPSGRLDEFAKMLGDWFHDAWVELIDFEVLGNRKYPIHDQYLNAFRTALAAKFPGCGERYRAGTLSLKDIEDGTQRKASPPVAFLGIFSGMHIDYFLSRTELANVLLVEPEPERFELSCYFLDYQAIAERFGKLLLSVGSEPAGGAIRSFFDADRVTPFLWTRILPGYATSHTPGFIEAFRSLQRAGSKVFFPVDIELDGLANTWGNLKKDIPVLARRKKLSATSRIAIVASGPSLGRDIEWLAASADKLIIFAVHSAVPVLRKHGIRPDFQFSIEAKPESETTRGTLMREVPLIAYCHAHPSWSTAVQQILLVAEYAKPQVVEFLEPLRYSHPSTANMALALATHCDPQEIYLLGCDFGYRDAARHHAGDSLWEAAMGGDGEQPDDYVRDTGGERLEPNFAGCEKLLSQPFLRQAHQAVEDLLAATPWRGTVYNLSDGVRIKGAIPRHSAEILLADCGGKQNDCQRILSLFEPPSRGNVAKEYALSGADLLAKYLANILEALAMEEFSWQRLADLLDNRILDKRLGYFSYHERDWRMDIYNRLFHDLFRSWYQYFLFCETKSEAVLVYNEGMRLLQGVFDSLVWPESD